MKKSSLTFIVTAFLVFAFVVGGVYYTGRQRKPLVFVEIPTLSHDWVKKIMDFNMINISIVDFGPFNWDNAEDPGQDQTKWLSIDTDPNFVVYYKKDQTSLNVQNARRVLALANDAVGEIQDLMGRYPYPESCNGRKLAIYLPSNAAEYSSIINSLAGKTCNSASSIGMHICHIGPLGALTDGIVLHPTCFDYEGPMENWADCVLRHEMNHFAFMSFIDFSKGINHPLWIVEGLAEYASWERGQVQSKDSIDFIHTKCDIDGEFPLESNAAYWAGRSFYQFVEDSRGTVAVKSFITDLYRHSLRESLQRPFETDTIPVKQLWVEDMKHRAGLDTLEVEIYVPEEEADI